MILPNAGADDNDTDARLAGGWRQRLISALRYAKFS
jgi:hypothetical protein